MLKVREIMTRPAVTVEKGASVRKVCTLLIKNRVSGLPVTDEKGRLAGFVSERDIIGSVGLRNFPDKKAGDVMSKRVTSVAEDLKVDEAAKIFTEKPFRYLPVTKGGRVTGVISRKDVINRLVGQYY